MSDSHAFLRSRRSIRRFLPDPVPDSALERILVTATFAPSAHNCQPWRFVLIKEPTARTYLMKALTARMRADMQAEGAPESEIASRTTRSERRIQEAPALVLLCRDATAVRTDTPEETLMAVQSVAAAGQQLLLAAHAEGLGGNWICWPLYAQGAARSALDLPETWEPQALFAFGYPGETPKTRVRQPLQKLLIVR